MLSFLGFVFTFYIFLSLSSGVLYCPPGSFQVPNENVCAFAIQESQFYHNAAKKCISVGAITAKIQNLYENSIFFAMIAQNFSSRAPYIGVERQKNANVWTYSDGSPLTYQTWAPGEPNTSSEGKICAIMDPGNGQWKSAECSTDRPFFCTMAGHNGPCPNNWIYYAPTKFCYYLQPFTYYDNVRWQLFNFDTAETRCKAMGAHLASVHSAVENNFLLDLIASNVNASLVQAASDGVHSCWQQWAWIGLFGTGAKMNGYWTDGTPVDWTAVDPPNAQNYSYVMSNDPTCPYRQWGCANQGNGYARFICKMPAKTLTPQEEKKLRTYIVDNDNHPVHVY